MIFTDTRDKSVKVNFETAVMDGMSATTGGLYVPTEFPKLDQSLINKCPESSFREFAFNMARLYTAGEIADDDLMELVCDAYPFSPKVIPLDNNSYILELFHGPTCAFKDFGARFMARVMAHFNKARGETLHILVATSGDTGSAVGSAFSGVKGLDVTILYPAGKISLIQEKQLSTFTGNVRALKVSGTFDDCQKLVKTAFTDEDLRKKARLSSANSINIARLLPQSFYYMYATCAIRNRAPRDSKIDRPSIIVVVPSGNFGNLTSGLIAQKMGAPIRGFVAATNSNNTIPDWIATGLYRPRSSVETPANAMDVGAPSNFERIKDMYTLDEVRSLFASFWLGNEGIKSAIADCYKRTGYIIDPHGAVAYKAWLSIKSGDLASLVGGKHFDWTKEGLTPNIPEWASEVTNNNAVGVILETAHPAKFGAIVKDATKREVPLPQRLQDVLEKEDRAIPMKNDYNEFKSWFLDNLK